MTAAPVGSEKWSPEQREVWRKLVGVEAIKALPPEMRDAISAFAACLVETPYPFARECHRGTGEPVMRSGSAADFDETFRRFVAEEEARSWKLAAECLARSVAVEGARGGSSPAPPMAPPAPSLRPVSDALDGLLAALPPRSEVTLRLDAAAFDRLVFEARSESFRPWDWRPESGERVAVYCGVRIEAEP